MQYPIVEAFFLIRTALFNLLDLCLGILLSPQIAILADVVLYMFWLWVIYHLIAKPFIWLFSSFLKCLKSYMFGVIEKGE